MIKTTIEAADSSDRLSKALADKKALRDTLAAIMEEVSSYPMVQRKIAGVVESRGHDKMLVKRLNKIAGRC